MSKISRFLSTLELYKMPSIEFTNFSISNFIPFMSFNFSNCFINFRNFEMIFKCLWVSLLFFLSAAVQFKSTLIRSGKKCFMEVFGNSLLMQTKIRSTMLMLSHSQLKNTNSKSQWNKTKMKKKSISSPMLPAAMSLSLCTKSPRSLDFIKFA